MKKKQNCRACTQMSTVADSFAKRQEAKEMFADKLLAGLDSGKPIVFVGGYFQRKKRILARTLAKTNRL